MTNEPNLSGRGKERSAQIAKAIGMPEYLIFVVQLEEFDLTAHKRAVVIYHGVWSGPSVAALKHLCEIMNLKADRFPIYVVDADQTTLTNREIAEELFGPQIGAWGETCWIKDGVIVARDILASASRGPVIEARIEMINS